MTDIIFARPRHNYDSYTDFWALVELSGFSWVYVDQMELYNSNNTYITAPYNGDWKAHISNHLDHTAKLLHWNLERPGERTVAEHAEDGRRTIERKLFNDIIVSDKQLALDTGFTYVPVGSHAGLGQPSDVKMFDVVHLMCYSLRRAFMFDYLTPRQHLNGMSIAPNGWGAERHKSLQLSRFMLSIHQDNHPYIEPLRFALAAAYALPIVVDESVDTWPYVPGTGEITILRDYKNVARAIAAMRREYNRYRSAGVMMRNKMCGEMSFRKCIERYL